MFRKAALTFAALAFAGSASALVLTESATPNDSDETFVEENQEFFGNPVLDVNGVKVGTVIDVRTEPGFKRQLVVAFDEGAMNTFSGWIFDLDEKWESGGTIDLFETREELQMKLDSYAAKNPDALLDPEGILDK